MLVLGDIIQLYLELEKALLGIWIDDRATPLVGFPIRKFDQDFVIFYLVF